MKVLVVTDNDEVVDEIDLRENQFFGEEDLLAGLKDPEWGREATALIADDLANALRLARIKESGE